MPHRLFKTVFYNHILAVCNQDMPHTDFLKQYSRITFQQFVTSAFLLAKTLLIVAKVLPSILPIF